MFQGSKRISMYQVNMLDDIRFGDEDIVITELMVTPFSKEYQIVMQHHQVMIDHESIYPISFFIIEGELRVKVEGIEGIVRKGDVLSLESEVVHQLEALEDSVLRLTLFIC